MVDKFYIHCVAVVVALQRQLVAQYLRTVKYIAFVEVVEHTTKLRITQLHIVMLFQLRLQVRKHGRRVRQHNFFLALSDKLGDEVIFEGLFGLSGHSSLIILIIESLSCS